MRDDDLAIVEVVQRELREVRWPDAAELRARARRRSRRTVVLAAVVLAVVSGTTVAVAAQPGAVPTLARGAGPSGSARTEIPAEALLSRLDLPVKADVEMSAAGLGEPVQVDPTLEMCARKHDVSVAPVESRYSRSRNLLRADPVQNFPRQVLVQDVYRLAPAASGRLFADLDRFMLACKEWLQTTPTERNGRPVTVSIQHHWQVVARDFAGDRAVLLRHTRWLADARNQRVGPDGGEVLRAVVQVRDLVTVLTPDAGMAYPSLDPLERFDEAQVRNVAAIAADRLCPAANPRC